MLKELGMTIHNFFSEKQTALTQQTECEEGRRMELAVEHAMGLYINNRFETRLVCSPEHLEELVVGRLCSEGLVSSPKEIISILICDNGRKATAFISASDTRRHPAQKAGLYATESAFPGIGENLSMPQASAENRQVKWKPEWLRTMTDSMDSQAPLYEQTHAVHSCFLMRNGIILCGREDIGRHNALDKVIGWAVINRVDLSECIAFTTGRLPLDMVRKAVLAGIPVLLSKTFPTREAVECAKENHLTMISIRSREEYYVWSEAKTCFERENENHDLSRSGEIAI